MENLEKAPQEKESKPEPPEYGEREIDFEKGTSTVRKTGQVEALHKEEKPTYKSAYEQLTEEEKKEVWSLREEFAQSPSARGYSAQELTDLLDAKLEKYAEDLLDKREQE